MEMDECNLASSESLTWEGAGSLPFWRMGYSYLKQGPGSHFEKVEVIGYAPADHPLVQVSSAIPSATGEGLCASAS